MTPQVISVLGDFARVRSYDDLDAWLARALEQKLARRQDEYVVFTGPLGRAVQKRYEALQDARRLGIPFDRADSEYNASIDGTRARKESDRLQIAMQRASEKSKTGRKRQAEVEDL